MSETVIQTQTNKFEHSSNTTAQDFKDATIEIQNNFYSSVIFKPMQINKNRHLAKLICIPQQNHGQS